MIVQVRHSENTGNTPVVLANGELALNAVDQLLYYKHANGAVIILANGASILTLSTAQVSSNQNHVPANTNAYVVVYNFSDLLMGATHTPGNSRITVLSNGWYEIVSSGNLRRRSGTVIRYADCWLRKNNVNITGTTTRNSLLVMDTDIPMHLHTTQRLEANDYIELILAVSATGGGTGLRDRTALDGGPDIRSVSLSITKIAT